jgi:tRNA threonylcarbamoyladenosine biosynthesis protein TsaE
MDKFQIISKSENETIELAKSIATCFHLGDVILLDGDLGSGKTHFVKGFASELGSSDPVTSPTFTIAQFYNLKTGSLLHIDTYRLGSTDEFIDTGLLDFFSESIVLIEWGTKIISQLDDFILITFEHSPSEQDTRTITFSYSGNNCAAQFELLSHKLSHLL